NPLKRDVRIGHVCNPDLIDEMHTLVGPKDRVRWRQNFRDKGCELWEGAAVCRTGLRRADNGESRHPNQSPEGLMHLFANFDCAGLENLGGASIKTSLVQACQ